MKAAELYIQSGYSEGIVIRTLGYPSYTALRNWYKKYLSTGSLHAASHQSLAIQKRKMLRPLILRIQSYNAGQTGSRELMMQGLPDPCQGKGVHQTIPLVKDSSGG